MNFELLREGRCPNCAELLPPPDPRSLSAGARNCSCAWSISEYVIASMAPPPSDPFSTALELFAATLHEARKRSAREA